MLETTRHNYRLIAILISTIGAGLPLWTTGARDINFTEPSFLLTWLFVGFVASFVSQFVVNLKARDMVGCFAIGYVTAVVLHFVGTILLTNYIQTQFEVTLLMAILTGALSGWFGSLLWTGVKSGKKKSKS
ncbi:MAG: hypothetical protein JJU37_15325 [Balneolaceae bacterium]|nr:hypothetical protein [Balneolaceae bacterium]